MKLIHIVMLVPTYQRSHIESKFVSFSKRMARQQSYRNTSQILGITVYFLVLHMLMAKYIRYWARYSVGNQCSLACIGNFRWVNLFFFLQYFLLLRQWTTYIGIGFSIHICMLISCYWSDNEQEHTGYLNQKNKLLILDMMWNSICRQLLLL